MATGKGTATLNFGAAPGTNVAVTTVTGQAGVIPGTHIDAWIMGDTTADHNAYEHSHMLAGAIGLACDNLVNGVGFDIVGQTELRLTGLVAVHWVWST